MSGTTGTPRSQSFLLTSVFQAQSPPVSGITSQSMRDLTVSVFNCVPTLVTASGSTQANATVLTAPFSIATTVASGTGVVVPVSGYSKVWNFGANSLSVYPPSGAGFNGLGTNIAVTVGVSGALDVYMANSTTGYVL